MNRRPFILIPVAVAALLLIALAVHRSRRPEPPPGPALAPDTRPAVDDRAAPMEAAPDADVATDDGYPDPAREQPKEDEIAPVVRAVIEPDNPRRMHISAHELPGPRTSAETDMLISYLTDNPIGEYEYLGEEFGHRNYIMDVLREQRHAWSRVVDGLVRVYAEPRQGDVLRGYALQHLASLYIDNPRDLPSGLRASIIGTLRSALPERADGTLAATALVGLHEISRTDPEAVSATEVEGLALELLHDPASENLTLISALHIAGERRLSGAVGEARRLAADPDADWVVRMASAYVLGRTGADPALLRQLSQDPDENVRGAALAALRKEVP